MNASKPLKALPIAKTLSLDVGMIHFVGIGGNRYEWDCRSTA